MWAKLLSVLSAPHQDKPGSQEYALRMMKELQRKLDAKEKKCDRCEALLTPEEEKSPRIILNYHENWLLCRKCR